MRPISRPRSIDCRRCISLSALSALSRSACTSGRFSNSRCCSVLNRRASAAAASRCAGVPLSPAANLSSSAILSARAFAAGFWPVAISSSNATRCSLIAFSARSFSSSASRMVCSARSRWPRARRASGEFSPKIAAASFSRRRASPARPVASPTKVFWSVIAALFKASWKPPSATDVARISAATLFWASISPWIAFALLSPSGVFSPRAASRRFSRSLRRTSISVICPWRLEIPTPDRFFRAASSIPSVVKDFSKASQTLSSRNFTRAFSIRSRRSLIASSNGDSMPAEIAASMSRWSCSISALRSSPSIPLPFAAEPLMTLSRLAAMPDICRCRISFARAMRSFSWALAASAASTAALACRTPARCSNLRLSSSPASSASILAFS